MQKKLITNEKIRKICSDNQVTWDEVFNQKEEIDGAACSTLTDLFISTLGDKDNMDALIKFASSKKSQIRAHQKHTAQQVIMPKIPSNATEDEAKFISITRKIMTSQEQTVENLLSPTLFKPHNMDNNPKGKIILKHRKARKEEFNDLRSKLKITSKDGTQLRPKEFSADFFESSSLPIGSKDRLAAGDNESDNRAYKNLAVWLIKKIDALNEPVAFKFSLNEIFEPTRVISESAQHGHMLSGFKINGKIIIFDPNSGVFSMDQNKTPNNATDNRQAWLENYLSLRYKKMYYVPISYFQSFVIEPKPAPKPK